ncbi:UDP-2,4-diacetamido-2,4,6-trideoxy-beta-L-altropyranose hydrolase [Desulfuribacillus stibiiarsenatis]|uniref:UDP-2,4-diacetamido-2,4, 6-trideoxy-beta-L-altropyranose hydrolase n=1 Tax=Desulfuribacillus stibiiarsenatis TaxID=1390249 RepID=A0A1E5L9P9_9FIRM|nr:UDP-2,4-diacetamido-2,4,6-trideoxy-beta-L-altropyranose hydrolase [Desulfuribacillus stibiiarsenatis]OEH86754.1 UDP-2,4-diacetamido-2,4,6-trideoxy-beta-L-altropyranose hydrolase [Desulfuribacillus stibiiarsenatis]
MGTRTILIRADASVNIGTGHIMRCLTLAEQIRSMTQNVEICFICQRLEGNLITYIQNQYNIPVLEVHGDDNPEQLIHKIIKNYSAVDLLIVDHYQLDSIWHKKMRDIAKNILVIDDLSNRELECDALLDQNYNENMFNRYKHFVPEHCRLFIGPKHLLLRNEFLETKAKARLVGQTKEILNLTKILIFYGGSDPTNETEKALEALMLLKWQSFKIKVIVGITNPKSHDIKSFCKSHNIEVLQNVSNMAEILMDIDIVLGSGGVSMWERCYLGIPTITTIVAENQRQTTIAASAFGAVWNAGWHEEVQVDNLVELIQTAVSQPEELHRMAKLSFELMQLGTEGKLLEWINEVVTYEGNTHSK